jgi:hypothetical protein
MALVMPSAWPRRRATALSLLFAVAVMAQAVGSFAQPVYDEYELGYGGAPDCGYACASDCAPGYSMGYCEPPCNDSCFGGVWFGAEYLRWRIEGGDPLPPLVTDAPADSQSDIPGALGNADTRILYGNETVGEDWRSGYRLYGGAWLDCCQCCGISGDYFNTDNDNFFISDPDSTRIVTRPFFDTDEGENSVEDVNTPGELEGTVAVATGDDFSGAGITVQRCVRRCCDPCGCGPSSQVYFLGGYRYYQYDTDLVITEDLLITGEPFPGAIPGTTIFVQDRFFTENEFHGGEAGFQGMLQQSCWWVDGLFKVAVGSHRRVVTIDGHTTTMTPEPNPTVQTSQGGLLALNTNIGRYADNTIAVIPELRVGVGTQLTRHISARAGYGVILWNAVARAGSQLPPGLEVDSRNIPPIDPSDPGGSEPEFPGILGNPLVAHGFDFGIQFTY